MQVIVLKYVQLVCITFFMRNNVNCAQLMIDTKEMTNLKVSACVANCLDQHVSSNLTECYQQCANQSDSLSDVRSEAFNASFGLYCRDSTRLLIQVESDSRHVENEKFIYLVTIQETTSPHADRLVYISDMPLIELHDLKSSESYNVSATIVSSNYEYSELGTQQHTTLYANFVPDKVTEVTVGDFQPIEGDGQRLRAVVKWKPIRQRTCSYEVSLHNPKDDWNVVDKDDIDLYFHEYDTLIYDNEHAVSVRGSNRVNDSYQIRGPVNWISFKTPSCWNLTKSQDVCGPIPIELQNAKIEVVTGNVYALNVTWNEPLLRPEYYEMAIQAVGNGSEGNYSFKLHKNATSFFNSDIALKGHACFITLTAYSNNMSVYESYYIDVPPPLHEQSSHFYHYSVVLVVALVVLVMFHIWKVRMIHVEQGFPQKLENLDLDLVKSISNRTMLETVADLTRDDVMEIERENIALLEILGEGNFGLVKKAVLVQAGMKKLVAVKMLKYTPNLEDVKQFHQEISVMKSVGKHKNVVSIIGHCTTNIEELMLLTEFCDAGSLYELLKSERENQACHYRKQLSCAPIPKYPESLHNFDDSEKIISNKSLEYPSSAFAVNRMYDALNNNENEIEKNQRQPPLDSIAMTATNALYLMLNENDPQSLEAIPEPEVPAKFLESIDLVSFAKQVADGMDFLAKKKVVHRDLAARNILVCSDRTAKIADFGLSRDIYQDNIYRKVGKGKLPIKWLAVESMTHQVYTSSSDVWSFGILLYEIVTLGGTPYPAITADNLLELLKNGYRMDKPQHCHHSLYKVMKSCWEEGPNDRPTFEELSLTLNHLMKQESLWDEQFIDLHKLFVRSTSDMNYLKPIA